MNKNPDIERLHLITHVYDDYSPYEQSLHALLGGCKWIQLRMKKTDTDVIKAEAEKILTLKNKFDFTLIINDNPELALMVGADGVHLGKQDMSPSEARKILGNQFIIGGTANTINDIEHLIGEGVDYIGLGPFRFTSTKENLSPILGIDGYQDIFNQMQKRDISIPIVCIGGILLKDAPELLETGMHGLAVSSAILRAKSPELATKSWINTIQDAKDQRSKDSTQIHKHSKSV